MGRGKTLSEREKGKIEALQGEGKSLKSIAKDVGRSPHVIRNFIENRDGYGTHFNRSGRKKKLSARDERQIARAASNSMKSCATIKTELKLDVERTTVWRSIQRNPHLVRQKLMSAPRLEPIHERNRLEFARINMGKDWILVRFLSFFNTVFRSFFLTKKFNLDGPDGFNSYWRDLRKEPRYFSKRNFGGGSGMVWAAISGLGKLKLKFISKRMDGREYQQVLTESLVPFIRRFQRLQLEFQQDNAGVHRSTRRRPRDPTFVPMMTWFQQQGINVLPWPSRSPDLNPIENVWGILVRDVYADNRQYQTVEELKTAIMGAWNRLPQETVNRLVESMRDRIFEVIQRSGKVTHY